MNLLLGMTIFQIALAVVCFWMVLMLMTQKAIPGRVLGTAFMATGINLGYLLEITSTSMDMAIYAVLFQLLCVTYYGTFLLHSVLEYCGKSIQKWILAVTILADGVIVASAWSYRSCDWFFTPLQMLYKNGIPYIISKRGPLDIVLHLLVIFELSVSSIVVLSKIHKSRTSDKIKRFICLFTATVLPLTASLLKVFDILQGVNLLPATAAIGLFVFALDTIDSRSYSIVNATHELIMDEMEAGVIVLDNSKEFIEANKKAYEIFPELAMMEKDQPIPAGYNFSLEDERQSFERNGYHYEATFSRIFSKDYQVGYCIMILDLTPQKKQLAEMERLKNEAMIASKAKTEFLAKVSHEIRTPIHSVLGMNEMILRESNDENILKYADDIKTASNALLGFISDILDTTKIETGRLEIVPVKYKLSDLLSDIDKIISVWAVRKDLRFEIEALPYIPNYLRGDEIRIKQVLVNLLTNAVKYTEKGSVTLRVKGYIEGRRVTLRFEVEDTGRGIKEEDIPHLFDDLDDIAMNEANGLEGTGLGLNISVKFLEMMKSELKVRSEYGKGSVFWFEIHQEKMGEELIGDLHERMEKSAVHKKYVVSFEAPLAKVLIVDDNKINRTVFKNLVKQTKVQVTEVGRGKDCLKLVEQEHYDLIFMDHMMPEMDGVETFHNMKLLEHNECKDTPVVVLTANAILGAKEQYLREGFASYLSKPIVPEDLEKTMVRFLPKDLVTVQSKN